MSTAHDLYQELSTLGVTIWQEGGQLRYRAPAGTVTHDLLARLRTHKDELLLAITQTIADACLEVGVDPTLLPDELRRDLLAIQGADLPYLDALIRDHAEWHGWAGVIRLADYAPGGQFYKEH